MCGRFSQILGKDIILKKYNLVSGNEPLISHNISPRMNVGLITQESPKFLSKMNWGLVPWWSKSRKFNYDYINVRSDKLFSVKTTQKLIMSQRCIIPASGFYEWKKVGNRKIPFYFKPKDGDFFSFAGIYSVWDVEDEPLYTFAIITTDPNEIVSKIHDRMPAILDVDKEQLWLDNSLNKDNISALLKPFQSRFVDVFEVSTKVNSTHNDSPDLITPIQSTIGKKIFAENGKKEQSTLDDWFT